jgi:hypothetical protein
MCETEEEILKIISPFSSVYSKCQLKLCSLPRALVLLLVYCNHQVHRDFLITLYNKAQCSKTAERGLKMTHVLDFSRQIMANKSTEFV